MKRQHPLALLRYTTMNFWLLLIPLVRGLMAYNFDWYRWLRWAFIDILVIIIILGWAYLRYRSVSFEFGGGRFTYKGGVFLKVEYTLPYSTISSVTTRRIFWLRPTKAVSVYIDSPARSPLSKKNDSDVFIITDLDTLEEIFSKIPEKTSRAKASYTASRKDLLLFSLVFSSTLSGAVFLAALFTQSGRLVQTQLEERFFTAVEDVTVVVDRVISGVTPLAVGISLLIAGSWLFSLISNIVRHISFSIRRHGNNIILENGFFSKWKYYINKNRINYSDIRQNLFMKIFKVMSVHISCSGYGNSKNEIPVLIPVTRKGRVESSVQMLLPDFTPKEAEIKPRFKYKWRFIGTPIFFILFVFAAAYISVWLFPAWYSFIAFLLVMFEIPLFYLLIVKFVSIFTTGIARTPNAFCLKYCKFFQYHDITIPLSRVAMVRIKQNPFQRRKKFKACDLIVYGNAESAKKHRVKGLPIEELFRDNNALISHHISFPRSP